MAQRRADRDQGPGSQARPDQPDQQNRQNQQKQQNQRPPSAEDVRDAAVRIAPFVHRTPVMTSRHFDGLTGAQLFFKCENLQKVGAFKIRGATNFVQQLSERQAAAGVVTHSSGNHGQAVAAAAQARGIQATVVMPRSASAVKRAAVAGYGATVVTCEDGDGPRAAAADRVVAEQGATLIHPYNHPYIIAGQGTLALELLEQAPELDAIIAPVGGGGALSGICIAARAYRGAGANGTDLQLFGAEPAQADDAMRSLASGRILPSEHPDTIADGLRTSLGPLTFAVLHAHVEAILTVSEPQIVAAMRALWQRMKLVVEPSAAVGLAAVLADGRRFRGKRVGVVLTGGNVDLDRLPW